MSIRLRLTLLFSVLVSVLLIGFAASVSILLSVERAKDFDALMASRAFLAGMVVLEENELDSAAHAATVLRFERSALPEEHITVYDADNNIPFDSDSLLQHPHRISLADNPAALKTARMGTSVYISNQVTLNLHPSIEVDMVRLPGISPFEVRFRSLYLPYDDENKRYVVVIRAFDRDGAQTQSDTVWILAVAVSVSLLIVAVTGWFFAVRMLAPVEGMTRLAEDISGSDLSKRLPEGNGRDELAHLARAFNGMFARIERAFSAQKQFVAHASHEIRTPLTAIIGEIGVTLSKPRSEEEYRETLDVVLSGALQMRQMASDLLQLARVESGTLTHDFTECALDEIVLQAVDVCEQTYPERRIITEIEPIDTTGNTNDEAVCLVLGNAEILRLIVVNILDNALKYSAQNTSVYMKLMQHEHSCLIEVKDSGAGIPQVEQERVFEAFYRSDRTRETAGTGIGLALVAEAVKLHQGFMRLSSAENVGTTLSIFLPIVEHSHSKG